MGYGFDREFTNTVHSKLAIPIIYKTLGWTETECSNIEYLDINKGIDYIMSSDNVAHSVQERFRESKYKEYNDFTIRLTRDYNQHKERQHSEFFKIEADYFIYGIINTSKYEVSKATDFIKYAVIDMKEFQKQYNVGRIKVDSTNRGKSKIENNIIVAGYNKNIDYSSEFVAFDIAQLLELFGQQMVVLQKGFK